MEIKKSNLLQVIEVLKDYIKENYSDNIVLDEDYYWDILSDEELYDPTKDPSEFGLGQLSDDWSDLLRLKDDKTPIPYDLKLLAMILIYLSSK